MGIDLTKLQVKQADNDVVKEVLDEVFSEADSAGKKLPSPVSPTDKGLDTGNVQPEGTNGYMLYEGKKVKTGDEVDSDGNTWVEDEKGPIQVKAKDLKPLDSVTGVPADLPEEKVEELSGSRKGGFWNTYLGDLIERIGAGASEFSGTLYSLADKIEKWSNPASTAIRMAIEQYNKRFPDKAYKKSWLGQQADNAYQYAETLRQRSDRYAGKNYSELWDEGKYQDMVGEVFLTASESLPQSVIAMTGGGAGLALTGTSAGVRKYDQLDAEPETKDLPEYQKLINAVATGTFEALSEKLGDVPIGKELARVYRKLGTAKAEKVIQDGVSSWIEKQFKRYGLLFAPVSEGVEEVASQIAENITDYCTGVSDEFRPLEGVKESFVYGAAGGGQFALMGVPGIAKRRYERYKSRKDYRQAEEKVRTLFSSDPEVDAFTRGITFMSPAEQETVLGSMARSGTMTSGQMEAVADFVNKANRYKLYKSEESLAQERTEAKEQFVQSVLREYDEGVRPITNENGIIQQVNLVGKESGQEVYIVKGDVVAERVGNDYKVDVEKSSPELYYRDAEGNMQVVSPSGVSVKYMEDAQAIRRQYEEKLREELELSDRQAEEAHKQNAESNRPAVENGDRITFIDDTGKETSSIVADAHSAVGYVFLDDGTPVGLERIVSAEQVADEEVTVPPEQTELSEDEAKNPPSRGPKVFEIEEGLTATETGDGSYLLNAEFTKTEQEKGKKLAERLNREYEEEGIRFELERLPKVTDNPLEKPRWGITGKVVKPTEQETETVRPAKDEALAENMAVEPEPISVEEPELSGKDEFVDDGLRKQYYDIKHQYPDNIRLFRKGNRSIALLSDAEELSEILGTEPDINSAGEKYFVIGDDELEAVINRVIKEGKRVAVIEQEVSFQAKRKKGRGFRYGKQERELGEYVSVRDEILRGIATGRFKFIWNDKDVRRGISSELGLSSSEKERRRRFWMFSNKGYSIDGLAHAMCEDSSSPAYGKDTEEVRNEIIDVMNTYDTPSAMIEAAVAIREPHRWENFVEALDDEELNWLNELEVLKSELEREPDNEIPIDMEEAFLQKGVTEKELNSLHSVDNFIKFVDKDVENEPTREEREPGTDPGKVAESPDKGKTPEDVTGEIENSPDGGRVEESPFSVESPGPDALTQEEQQIVSKVTAEVENEIGHLTRQLSDKRKQLIRQKGLLGRKVAQEGQLRLFEENKPLADGDLFQVDLDLSEKNLARIVEPLKQECEAIRQKIEDLELRKEKLVTEALEAHRKQGKLFEDEVTREDILKADADEQLKDMALDYLAGEVNTANRVAYLSLKNKIENGRNSTGNIERGGANRSVDASFNKEALQSKLSAKGESGRGDLSGNVEVGGTGNGELPDGRTEQSDSRRNDNGPRNSGGADEFSDSNGGESIGSVSGSPSGQNEEHLDSLHSGRSGRSTENGEKRATSSHREASNSQRNDKAPERTNDTESNRKASLDAELAAALSDFDSVLSKFKKAGKSDLSLSLIGLTNEQIETIGEIVAAGAKVGYVLLKRGAYAFKEWADTLKKYIGGKLREAGLQDSDIDELVGSMWDTKVRDENGSRKKISEFAKEYAKNTEETQVTVPPPTSFQEKIQIALEKQRAAESVPVVLNDADNIRATLPMLLPEQQDDVIKAELRLFGEGNKKGILFTNGTGTGKTFTGLGVIKRFARQGRNNVLIVVPSSEKVNDWSNDGKNLLLRITPLQDTKDAGEGIVVTTYANFRENLALKKRNFDLVVYDECHRLMESQDGNYSATTNTHFQVSNKDESYAVQRLLECDKDYQKWKEVWRTIKKLKEEVSEIRAKNKKEPNVEKKINVRDKQEKIKLLEKEAEECEKRWKAKEAGLAEQAKQDVERTKVVFLSATPFKTVFNLRYADGYLFDFPKRDYVGYNVATGENLFYIENFGAQFRMRYGRLETKGKDINPEAVSMQEVEFQQKLTSEGAMSGRAIESNMDYSRDFVKPHSDEFDTELFNEALNAIYDFEKDKYKGLRRATYQVFFSYNFSTRLMEVLKTSMFLPRMDEHIRLGRKVVVFHRRKQANVGPPFALVLMKTKNHALAVVGDKDATPDQKAEAKNVLKQCENFKKEFAEVLNYERTLNYSSAIDQIVNHFGADRVRLFNGDISKADKSRAVKDFNDDNSGVDVIVIQEESGKEGISLHDRTGKHPRVLMSLSAPISSITALQIEGRIYRIGQESNAIFEYPTLGLDNEMVLFSQNINRKLSTTENLALGAQARDLMRSFAEGIENWTDELPGESQGTGGKEADKRAESIKSPYERAVLTYFTHQKGKRDQREGMDYFPTPEPLGLKFVEWTGIRTGEWLLEPSAGHGAIAMWVPANCGVTAIEPSLKLYARLGGKVTNGSSKILNTTFEEHDLVNKYDAVAMNPPFGSGGALAIAHIGKAFKHLRNGGRLVAIVPNGGSMNKKVDRFLYGEDSKGRLLNPEAQLAGEVILPGCTFEQAGTSVYCRVLVIDKIGKGAISQVQGPSRIELNDCKTIDELFEKLEGISMPPRPVLTEDALREEGQGVSRGNGQKVLLAEVVKTQHTKTGEDMYCVKLNKKVSREVYEQILGIAGKHEGYYNRFKKAFTFTSEKNANDFRTDVESSKEEVLHRRQGWPVYEGVFYSNALRAVESMKQEKATPKQWLGMLERSGGLKAGEDEWLGLYDWLLTHDWLSTSDKKVLTKDEVLNYIRQNEIVLEEVEFQERPTDYTIDDVAGAVLNELMESWEVKFKDGNIEYVNSAGVNRKSESEAIESAVKLANYNGLGLEIDSTRLLYTTKGLKDKREVVFSVPDVLPWEDDDLVHFGSDTNGKVIAWARFGRTEDTERRSVLVIDEIQSSRHQQGRLNGYVSDHNKMVDEKYKNTPEQPFAKQLYQIQEKRILGKISSQKEVEENQRIIALSKAVGANSIKIWKIVDEYLLWEDSYDGPVPDAPFKKNWYELVFKRMLRYAAENGFDKIAWAKGNQQSERYGLNKVVDAIEWEKTEDSVYRLWGIAKDVMNGTAELLHSHVLPEELSDWVGKDIAKEILTSSESKGEIKGEGLKVGSKSLKKFYDEILVNFANKYGKRWRVKVEEVTLPNVEEAGRVMWSVDVTEAMKASVMQGQPLFRKAEQRENNQRRQRIIQEINCLNKGLNADLRVVMSRDDLPVSVRENLNADSRYPGLMRVKTGEVYLIADEITDERDAQRTFLHEVVGHKGIRRLFGEHIGEFTERVLYSLPEGERAKLVHEYGGNRQLAAEEYVAGFAEEYREPSLWLKIKGIIRDLFQKMGIKLRLTDGDLQYLLWRGVNGLRKTDGVQEVVDKVAKDEAMFREVEEENKVSIDKVAEILINKKEKLELHNEFVSRRFRFLEAYQDRMLSVKRLQELIEKRYQQKLPSYMDAYLFENTLASRNTYEMEYFRNNELRRLTDAIGALEAAGPDRRTIENYVMCKHGLERNEYMRKKELDKWYQPQVAELERWREIEGEKWYASELAFLKAEYNFRKAKLAKVDFSGLSAIEEELKRDGMKVKELIEKMEKGYSFEVDVLWKCIKECTDFALQKWFECGLINRERLEHIKGMYKNYVPLRGFDEVIAQDVYEYFTDEPNGFNSPLRKARGRRSRADNPFAFIASMAESSIAGGNKNLLKLHFFRLAQKYPADLLSVNKVWYRFSGYDEGGEAMYEAVFPAYHEDAEIYRKNIEDFNREMKDLEADDKAFCGRKRLNVGYRLLYGEPEEHTVRLKVNGDEYAVFVHGDPRPAQAIEGLNDEERIDNRVLDSIRWMNRQMAANFTTRNPAFIASNLVRDLVFSITMLSVKESGRYRNLFLKHVPSASGAISRYIRGKSDLSNRMDRLFQEFLENGGETGYTALYNVERYKKMIDNAINQRNESKFLKTGRFIIDFFAAGNRWAEDLARFSVYVTSRELGRPVLECVSNAKEVSVNFNRRGSGALGCQVFKSLYIFFNAAVQSLASLYGVAIKYPGRTAKTLMGYSIAGLLVPILLRALGGEDAEEEYLELPDYVRKNHFCFYLGKKNGFITIPLPIELRAFYGLGDSAYRYFRGDIGGITASGEVVLGVSDVLPLNPAGGNIPFVPDAFKPLAQAFYVNKNFAGRPVAKITPYNVYLPEYRRVYRGTSSFFLKSSEVCNYLSGGDYGKRGKMDQSGEVVSDLLGMKVDVTNPAALQHVVEEYLGGMFKTVMQSFETIGGLYRWGKTGDREELLTWKIPLLNRFYNRGDSFNRQRRLNERYFDALGELTEIESQLREYRRAMLNGEMAPEEAMGRYAKIAEGGAYEKMEVIKHYAGKIQQISVYLQTEKSISDEERRELEEEEYLLKENMLLELENLQKK